MKVLDIYMSELEKVASLKNTTISNLYSDFLLHYFIFHRSRTMYMGFSKNKKIKPVGIQSSRVCSSM